MRRDFSADWTRRESLLLQFRCQRDRVAPLNFGDVFLDGVKIGIGSVGIGQRQESIDGLAITLKFWLHKFPPEQGRAQGDVTLRLKRPARGREVDEVVRFLEFVEQDAHFIRIVGGSHLTEIVGGGEGASDDPLEGFADFLATDILLLSGAVDGAKHLWVGEPSVHRVLSEITKIIAPERLPLPTEI